MDTVFSCVFFFLRPTPLHRLCRCVAVLRAALQTTGLSALIFGNAQLPDRDPNSNFQAVYNTECYDSFPK